MWIYLQDLESSMLKMLVKMPVSKTASEFATHPELKLPVLKMGGRVSG